MSKRRIILLLVSGLAVVLFVLWPTINAWRVRHTVAVALQPAASVRLEEFAFHIPLASAELPRAEPDHADVSTGAAQDPRFHQSSLAVGDHEVGRTEEGAFAPSWADGAP